MKKRQQTALHIGVEAGYQDIVEILLGANASLDLREKVTTLDFKYGIFC